MGTTWEQFGSLDLQEKGALHMWLEKGIVDGPLRKRKILLSRHSEGGGKKGYHKKFLKEGKVGQ